jgi:hypothetical protein
LTAVTTTAAPLRDSVAMRSFDLQRRAAMTRSLLRRWRRFLLSALVAAVPLWPQAAEIGDDVCVSCHAEPSRRAHSQPSHKKLACATCHVGGAQHVADTRVRPKLGGDEQLCASCHAAKKKHSGN